MMEFFVSDIENGDTILFPASHLLADELLSIVQAIGHVKQSRVNAEFTAALVKPMDNQNQMLQNNVIWRRNL